MKKLLFILILIIPLLHAAQSQDTQRHVVAAQVIDGDTILVVNLREIEIYSLYRKTKRQTVKLTKLIRNVKKVYPYAKLAGIKLNEYELLLLQAKDDTERKKIMKMAEKEIKEEFTDDIRDMTTSQGIILIKLIDRETGQSSYELVQELRGNFTAFFYQAFARLFGVNLKTEYDPTGKDVDIEVIVRMIESGQI